MFLGVQIHPCGSFHGCFPGRGNERLNTELTSNQPLRSLDPLKPLGVPFTQHFPNLRCHPNKISFKKKEHESNVPMLSAVLCSQISSQLITNVELDPCEWRSYRFEASLMNALQKAYLAGGFNPSEKYESNWIISPEL